MQTFDSLLKNRKAQLMVGILLSAFVVLLLVDNEWVINYFLLGLGFTSWFLMRYNKYRKNLDVIDMHLAAYTPFIWPIILIKVTYDYFKNKKIWQQ